MDAKEQLLRWLNDAYSMELSVAEILTRHARDASEYTELQMKIQQHIAESERHAEKVARCVELLGGTLSRPKAVIGDLLGRFTGMATGIYRDELVKNLLLQYATEHFEIASYRSLIAAADACGAMEVAQICEQILEEEEEMADWVGDRIATITAEYLEDQQLRPD
jgi:ferritin-like metal-binding protein YciE